MTQIIGTQIVLDFDTQIPLHRAAKIFISQGGAAYEYHVGGLPLEGDLQVILDSRFDELWAAASAAGNIVPEYQNFVLPIKAPALYADDVFVSSRDIKDDPLEALAEALTETKKGKGKPKSLDMIARSTLKALEHAMKEIDKLRLDVEKLRKKVK